MGDQRTQKDMGTQAQMDFYMWDNSKWVSLLLQFS